MIYRVCIAQIQRELISWYFFSKAPVFNLFGHLKRRKHKIANALKVLHPADICKLVLIADRSGRVGFSLPSILPLLFPEKFAWRPTSLKSHFMHLSAYLQPFRTFKQQRLFFFSSYMALQLLYRILAFSTNSFHLILSCAKVFQFGTFIFCISFLTSSPQRVFGLPVGLLDMGFQE